MERGLITMSVALSSKAQAGHRGRSPVIQSVALSSLSVAKDLCISWHGEMHRSLRYAQDDKLFK